MLPHAAPILADAFEAGTDVLPKTKQMNEDLADVFEKLADFGDDPMVRAGVHQLTRFSTSLRPTLRFLTPAQTTCNYASIFLQHRQPAAEGDANGNYQRFATVSAPTDPITFELGPNNEGGPSDAPANGPGRHNHLHVNPYPNSAGPGQSRVRGRQRALRGRPDRDRQHAREPGPEDGRSAMRRSHQPRLTAYQAGLIALIVLSSPSSPARRRTSRSRGRSS